MNTPNRKRNENLRFKKNFKKKLRSKGKGVARELKKNITVNSFG